MTEDPIEIGPRVPAEVDPVTSWAQQVAAGEIVAGPYIRAAARRHLRDLRDGSARGLVWDLPAAMRAVRFFPDMLALNGGRFTGQPFHLHPSQAFRVGSLFGWKWSPDHVDPLRRGRRRFRRFYDEEGKGNGKSPMLAGIGLYMLVSDGESAAEVYAAASKKDQAQVLFRDAVAAVEQSRRLSRRIKSHGKDPVWQLSYRGRRGDRRFFKPISADDGQSGPRPHCALCDEVHEHKNRDVIDMLERGFKFREQPLLCMATNAGTDRKSICYEEHTHAVNVVTGTIEDDETFAFVCSLDDGDDWEEDPSCWIKANPCLGEILTDTFLAGEVRKARQMPGKRNGIARLHFCEWTQSVTAAIKRETWAAVQKPLDLEALIASGVPCFGGLDLSQTRDFTALSLVWLLDATKGSERMAAKTWIWTPEDTLRARAARDQAPYDQWAAAGHVEAVPGERLHYGWLAEALASINARFAPEAIAGDQYGLERLGDNLADLGVSLPVVIHPQGFQKRILEKDPNAPEGQGEVFLWMPHSINQFEEALGDGRLEVDPNPLLDSMAAGVTYAENRSGYRMFDKEKAHVRIDGMVSLAMGVGMALCRERSAGPSSPWDDPNFTMGGSWG
ncbi:Phage Terminase [Pseudooceanicola marinus]|uniref:Phage Terminase n=1 Tax=Pseudooceanicola marinus TaxID=396013 RepID=A0A1X7A6R5_9RHOB|nr:terminase large subunit [Pseudooceanicola marinus]PJE27144.1 terminase [Pseudooceanicola marinus]SLN70299.1 Phage Terminase [Pseudooceanicola marinus]